MLIGESGAVDRALGGGAEEAAAPARWIGRASPSMRSRSRPRPGETGLRAATLADLDLLVPACAAAHLEEIAVDPLAPRPDGFRWRTRSQIEEGRSWLWVEDGVIRFKAEASAWTREAVQLQQVWTDPPARGRGYAGARCVT